MFLVKDYCFINRILSKYLSLISMLHCAFISEFPKISMCIAHACKFMSHMTLWNMNCSMFQTISIINSKKANNTNNTKKQSSCARIIRSLLYKYTFVSTFLSHQKLTKKLGNKKKKTIKYSPLFLICDQKLK